MFWKGTLSLMIAVFSNYLAVSQGAPVQLYQNGYYIKQYTESNGLVSNKCKYLFEDSKGFYGYQLSRVLVNSMATILPTSALKMGYPA